MQLRTQRKNKIQATYKGKGIVSIRFDIKKESKPFFPIKKATRGEGLSEISKLV